MIIWNAGKGGLVVFFQHQKYHPSHPGTLLILLREEIDELQQGVMEMRESSLIKAVAKRKVKVREIQVVYNISKQG